MKCKVCGAESGKYPLCRACNIKKEQGEIIKCPKCETWHLASSPCEYNKTIVKSMIIENHYLYDAKKVLISNSEQSYYSVILSALPSGYHAFPQVNLASFIVKNDDSPFHNELFRNVDFLVTDAKYQPLFIIEINDQTHLNADRKERDEKVKRICEEAGIPIVRFWTSYGLNSDYIRQKIDETLKALPVERIYHFNQVKNLQESSNNYSRQSNKKSTKSTRSGGCYIATCVYESYDCPEVWVLRRYRDNKLALTWYGKLFIKLYYKTSPILVRAFGKYTWFHNMFTPILNKLITNLRSKGFEDTPYNDPD